MAIATAPHHPLQHRDDHDPPLLAASTLYNASAPLQLSLLLHWQPQIIHLCRQVQGLVKLLPTYSYNSLPTSYLSPVRYSHDGPKSSQAPTRPRWNETWISRSWASRAQAIRTTAYDGDAGTRGHLWTCWNRVGG